MGNVEGVKRPHSESEIVAFAAIPVWILGYLGVLAVYRLHGISEMITPWCLISPIALSILNVLFFKLDIPKRLPVSERHWIVAFLILHLSLLAYFLHVYVHPDVRSMLAMGYLITALLFLNPMIGYKTTAFVGVIVFACTIGVSFIQNGELSSGERTFAVLGVFVTILCAVVNQRSYLTFRKIRRLYANSEEAHREINVQKAKLEALANKLSKYLSPQIYNSIFCGDKEVKAETCRKKLTVFFSDIESFASLTDSMEAESLSNLLNEYLTDMSEIALRHGGTVDKFMGDGIMVFFGDPETNGETEDALACVMMAMEMRQHMKVLRKKWEARGFSKPLRIRMGINTGYCTVGNFGSDYRLEYTIIGGQVNLASRLEALADPNQILIANETYSLVRERIQCRKNGVVSVKGISNPVQTHYVEGFRLERDACQSTVEAEDDGLSLSIDLDRMDRDKAIEVLSSVIDKIQGA